MAAVLTSCISQRLIAPFAAWKISAICSSEGLSSLEFLLTGECRTIAREAELVERLLPSIWASHWFILGFLVGSCSVSFSHECCLCGAAVWLGDEKADWTFLWRCKSSVPSMSSVPDHGVASVQSFCLFSRPKGWQGGYGGHWLGLSKSTYTLLMKSSLNPLGEYFTCLLDGESTLACCHSCNEQRC